MLRGSCQKGSSSILSNSFLIKHSCPTIDEDDIISVTTTLKSNDIAQGRCVSDLENIMSDFVGRRGAVAVNSGTSALHLALLALNVKEGDEVIIPSFVCSALLNALYYVKAKPCFADIDPDTFNLAPRDLKKRITKKTKLIMVPHNFGLPADMNEIIKNSIPVLEDCAQSLGAHFQGKKVGNFGIASVLSFYATKVITTGEGGMVLSNSQELLKKVRDLRDYDEKKEYRVRYNYKMTDIQASLGISQFKKLPSFIEKRRMIAKKYSQEMKPLRGIMVPQEPQGTQHIYYRYIVKTEKSLTNVLSKLRKEGIEVKKPVFKPLHYYFPVRTHLKHTENIWRTAFSIPIYPSLNNGQIEMVIQKMKEVFS